MQKDGKKGIRDHKILNYDLIMVVGESVTIVRLQPYQGRTIRTGSEQNILSEVKTFYNTKRFKGIISCWAPTANMYGYECKRR